jgi:hypothetical protein
MEYFNNLFYGHFPLNMTLNLCFNKNIEQVHKNLRRIFVFILKNFKAKGLILLNDEKNLNNLSEETATKLLSRKFLSPGRNCIFKRLFGDEKNIDIAKSFFVCYPRIL